MLEDQTKAVTTTGALVLKIVSEFVLGVQHVKDLRILGMVVVEYVAGLKALSLESSAASRLTSHPIASPVGNSGSIPGTPNVQKNVNSAPVQVSTPVTA